MREWNEDEIATLRTLWSEKWSAGSIAKQMGKTRNSVIGKARRLGLEARRPARVEPYKPRVQKLTAMFRAMKPVVMKPVVRKPLVERPVEPQPRPLGGVSILQVGHGQCRAIIDATEAPGGLTTMCGQPVYANTAWCEDHFQQYTTRRS